MEAPGVDWAEGLIYSNGELLKTWRAASWERTLSFIRSENAHKPIHLFLGYLHPQQVEESAIRAIQRMGIPCVNFFCDNVRELKKIPNVYRCFDLHWVPEYEALPMYQDTGLPHLHAPMPCWVPQELRTVPNAETEPPVFIGSADSLRRDLLGRALNAGGDFMIYGSGWLDGTDQIPAASIAAHPLGRLISNQVTSVRDRGLFALYRKLKDRLCPLSSPAIPTSRLGFAVSNKEYIRISREATVTIGVNRVPTWKASNRMPLTYSRLRDIEAPMLGACYLTEWTAGLSELYELGTEVETYKTPEELSAKIVELKKDRKRRTLMRERAQMRALTDHSVPRTIARICERLGLASEV